jgi:RNA-directed DNA polymerase
VHGWTTQSHGLGRDEFRAHLLGRVAWVGSIRPEHGHRLAALADRIDWGADAPA